MFAPVLTALALVALQAAAGTLKLSDVARLYARRSQINAAAAMDIENTPRLETGLAWPTLELGLDYSPRLTWGDVLGSAASPTLLLQSAELRMSLRRPRYTLSLSQTGTIGQQDFSQSGPVGLAGTGSQPGATGSSEVLQPDLDLLPSAEVVRVAAEETTANLRYALSRRWTGEFQAGFGFSGGANATARRFLPQQRRAQLDASFDYALSPSDELGSALSGAQIATSNGYNHWLATVLESWSASWTESVGTELGLGAAIQDSEAPDGSHSGTWVPVGSASLRHALLTRDVKAQFQWDVGYGPDVNVILGTLQSRFYATSQATLAVERTRLSFTLRAAQTFPADAPDAARLLGADVTLDHELLEWLSVQLGGQVTWQRFASAAALASALSVWRLYAGLEGRVPELRF